MGFWDNDKYHGYGSLISKEKVKFGFWIKGTKEKNFRNKDELMEFMGNDFQIFKKFFVESITELRYSLFSI